MLLIIRPLKEKKPRAHEVEISELLNPGLKYQKLERLPDSNISTQERGTPLPFHPFSAGREVEDLDGTFIADRGSHLHVVQLLCVRFPHWPQLANKPSARI